MAAVLLVTGAAAASGRLAGDGDSEAQAVLAAGGTVDAVEPTLPVPPVLPPAVPLPTTTVAATTTSTRSAPATTTRPAPAPSTSSTSSTRPAAPSTTSTTAPPKPTASVTVVNNFSHDIVVTLNGQRFQVSPGRQAGPQALALALNGNDVIEVTVVERPLCGLGDAGGFFQAGGRYRVEVYALTPSCDPMDVLPGPGLRVTAL